MRSQLVISFLHRLFTRCCDCGGWLCPVWLAGDEEREHRRSPMPPTWVTVIITGVALFLVGFSTAMGLIGDSPWSEFWLRMAGVGQ